MYTNLTDQRSCSIKFLSRKSHGEWLNNSWNIEDRVELITFDFWEGFYVKSKIRHAVFFIPFFRHTSVSYHHYIPYSCPSPILKRHVIVKNTSSIFMFNSLDVFLWNGNRLKRERSFRPWGPEYHIKVDRREDYPVIRIKDIPVS